MPIRPSRLYCRVVQIIVRSLVRLTGRGGGKFAQFLPPGETFLMTDYCGDLTFQVDTTYPMEATTWLAGVYDSQTTHFLRQMIQPGDVVLDVGANCGALTLVAASLVEHGQVYAFEPSPTIRQRLQANVTLNAKLPAQLQVLPLGLGATPQQLLYYEDPNYPGNGALLTTQGSPVEVVPLDQWVATVSLPKLDFLKIDVEGMEYEVLMGAKQTLQQFHPILYFETLPIFFVNKPYTVRSLYEFLMALGYEIHHPVAPYRRVPLDGPYPANSVALQPHQVERLPAQPRSVT